MHPFAMKMVAFLLHSRYIFSLSTKMAAVAVAKLLLYVIPSYACTESCFDIII